MPRVHIWGVPLCAGKVLLSVSLEGCTPTLPTKVEATLAPSDPPLPNPVSLWFVCMSVSLLYIHADTYKKQEEEM